MMADELSANETLAHALEYANSFYNEWGEILEGFLIDNKELIFEERVSMNCFYCEKYGRNWRCPPRLPSIDYKRMFCEYENCAAVYLKVSLKDRKYDEVRSNSSLILHRGLLQMEKYLWEHDNSEYLSFIGGSCKLCKNGCGEEHCNNPYMSRSPVEATGINIVKTMEKYGLEIKFPPKEYMIRCGLLIW